MADKSRSNPRKVTSPARGSAAADRAAGRTPTSASAKAKAAQAGSAPTGKAPAGKPPTGRTSTTKAQGGAKPARQNTAAQKASSIRQQQKALRAIQSRRNARRQTLVRVGVPVLAVVVIVAALIIVRVAIGGKNSAGTERTAASAATVAGVTGVPLSVFNSVGVGGITSVPSEVGGTALTDGGLPEVLYMGAEYCPYCAAERWSTAAALSRFGTFTGLKQTASSSVDVNPSTPTLSFYGATYTSKYISFTGVEMQSNKLVNNAYQTLQTPTAAQQALLTKYDQPPYVSSSGGIPFLDFGNTYISSGASYDGSILKGLTHEQIAQDMSDPTTPVGQKIDGAANIQTAAICELTKNQPANVCTSAGVVAARAKLPTKVSG